MKNSVRNLLTCKDLRLLFFDIKKCLILQRFFNRVKKDKTVAENTVSKCLLHKDLRSQKQWQFYAFWHSICYYKSITNNRFILENKESKEKIVFDFFAKNNDSPLDNDDKHVIIKA